MTSVIIVQYNHADLTAHALRSFLAHHPDGHEIIVVDNGSTDPDAASILKEFPGVQLLRNKRNEGFSRANNLGAKVAKGEYLLFLNSDTITDAPFVPTLEEVMDTEPDAGILGPRLRYPDGRFQLSAGRLPGFLNEIADKVLYHLLDRRIRVVTRMVSARWNRRREPGWVTGAALYIRNDLFQAVGGFDEAMFMYFEDKDLCRRVRDAGFRVCYLPEISLVHIKAGSSRSTTSVTGSAYRQSQIIYYRKHRPRMESHLLRLYLKGTGKAP